MLFYTNDYLRGKPSEPGFTAEIYWSKEPHLPFDIAYVCLYPDEPSGRDKVLALDAGYSSVEALAKYLEVRNNICPIKLPMPLSFQGGTEPKIAG